METTHYENFKGGINNLIVATLDDGTVGTSVVSKQQALRNAKRNKQSNTA